MNIQTLFMAALVGVSYAHKDFAAIAKYVREGPPVATTDDQKLQIYGLYKQATKGDCGKFTGQTFSVKDRMMHSSWCKYAGMSSADAEDQYVALLDSIVPAWRS